MTLSYMVVSVHNPPRIVLQCVQKEHHQHGVLPTAAATSLQHLRHEKV